MRKRNNIIVLSLILAAMIASGCGGSAQTAASPASSISAGTEVRVPADGKEYLEVLKDIFHEYADSSFPLADDLEAKNYDAAKKDLENMEAALSKVETVTPPEQYADQQKKIVDSLVSEREYLNNCRKFIGYCEKGADRLTEDDIKEVQKLNKALEDAPADFSNTYIEVFRTVKADIDN